MADITGGYSRVIYSHQYNDEKHVPGTTRLIEKEDEDFSELVQYQNTKFSNRLVDRIKNHWLSDFMPIILESIIWIYVIGRFYGFGAFVGFLIPGIPVLLYLLLMLGLEINEWRIFKKKIKTRYKNINSCI